MEKRAPPSNSRRKAVPDRLILSSARPKVVEKRCCRKITVAGKLPRGASTFRLRSFAREECEAVAIISAA